MEATRSRMLQTVSNEAGIDGRVKGLGPHGLTRQVGMPAAAGKLLAEWAGESQRQSSS